VLCNSRRNAMAGSLLEQKSFASRTAAGINLRCSHEHGDSGTLGGIAKFDLITPGYTAARISTVGRIGVHTRSFRALSVALLANVGGEAVFEISPPSIVIASFAVPSIWRNNEAGVSTRVALNNLAIVEQAQNGFCLPIPLHAEAVNGGILHVMEISMPAVSPAD
jgi:hypothetical protein